MDGMDSMDGMDEGPPDFWIGPRPNISVHGVKPDPLLLLDLSQARSGLCGMARIPARWLTVPTEVSAEAPKRHFHVALGKEIVFKAAL